MDPTLLFPELEFKASRSGGAGGQNVNKVSTKVEISFDISASLVLNDEQKEKLRTRLASKINVEGKLRLMSQSERTQLGNKKVVLQKFSELISKAFTEQKKRKPTKATRASKEKRLEGKKRDSQIKALRRNVL